MTESREVGTGTFFTTKNSTPIHANISLSVVVAICSFEEDEEIFKRGLANFSFTGVGKNFLSRSEEEKTKELIKVFMRNFETFDRTYIVSIPFRYGSKESDKGYGHPMSDFIIDYLRTRGVEPTCNLEYLSSLKMSNGRIDRSRIVEKKIVLKDDEIKIIYNPQIYRLENIISQEF